ncbi:MAG: hypothetical protein KDC66_18425 [Phaeodactylibacter sp.]|nr:hypothetical protein [Phaeodactylibacter sp.]MCB9273068.1 hypothetical protein [Lewinellaceae bacterium]
MRNNYSPGNGTGLGGLLKGLGVITALILLVGLLDKAGVRISVQGQENKGPNAYYSSAIPGAASEKADGEVIVVSPEGNSTYEEESWEPVGRSAKASHATRQTSAVDDWVGRFSNSAIQQAIRQGIPAGIALAVGITKMEEGVHIDSWQAFMEKVILPLAHIKDSASENDRSSYFKYSANSSRWADGLARNANFSASVLKRNLDRYSLHEYDRAVKEKLSDKDVVDIETERKARAVADEVATSIRNRKAADTGSRRSKDTEAADEAAEWENFYDESVGHEVAKEIARKKLKSGQYISEEDMSQLVEETNTETSKVLDNNLSFLGRKINRNKPGAEQKLDISDPGNAQAREELYQRKLQEKRRGN